MDTTVEGETTYEVIAHREVSAEDVLSFLRFHTS